MRVILYNNIENYIRFYRQLIVDLVVAFCLSEYVQFFKGINHMAFIGDVGGIHDVFHWASGVPIFYTVPSKTGFVISVFKVPKVFLERSFKSPTSLTYVFLVARREGELVYSTVVILLFCLAASCC